MEFKLSFAMDNAAFEGDHRATIAEILASLAKAVGDGRSNGMVYDPNGNKVGAWEIVK